MSSPIPLSTVDDSSQTLFTFTVLDVAHVRDNVQADLVTLEDRNGPITRKLVSQLLTLQVLNDSMEVSIKKFRKEVVDNVHQGFTKEFHIFKLMT